MFKGVPIKIVVPIIVITWILSLISSLAIVYVMPSLSSVRSEQIADEAIITVKLADGSVTSAKIKDGNITAVDLADGSVINVKVHDDAVTTSKIADKNVTTDKIADYAIIEIKLAGDCVTSAKIKDGTITAEDLSTGAVTEITIKDYAVTTNKIANYAVTGLKLSAYAIPFNSTSVRPLIPVYTATMTPSWQPMPGMSVTVTLTRTSYILIMLNLEAWVGTAPESMWVRALVNTTSAYPNYQALTAVTFDHGGSYSCNFYLPDANAGVSTVTIEWTTLTGTNVYAMARTLIVFALPA